MKITRILAPVILLSILLSTFQIGEIQAFNRSSGLAISNPAKKPDLSVKTNRSSSTNPSISIAPDLRAQTGSCHFGMTVPNGVAGYDLSILGVDGYLDWWYVRNSSVAANIQYYPMLGVSDAYYQTNLTNLPALLSANPGATWIIGNEPDSEVTYQDHITAESYAERFYAMAKIIRSQDPTAKITFGTIIQPTPVRLYYLSKAIDRLVQLAQQDGKTRADALSLIDIYSIHAFILNEQPLYDSNGKNINWGAGIPLGYDANTWPPIEVIAPGPPTYDINTFKDRVIKFRQWMNALGPLEQSKPLWITEYGSLFPTWLGVTELQTATYMEQTFDFMLGTKDATLGNASDDNRLVQKWFWYSLNELVTKFGGSLYNPLTQQITTVGDHFIKYNPSTTIIPVTDPDAYIDPTHLTIGPGSMGHYKVTVKVGNTVSSDRLTGVQVDLLDGANVVGTVTTNLPRCAGILPVSFDVSNLVAGTAYSFTARVTLVPGNGTDLDPSNDEITFPSVTMPVLYNSMLPLVLK